MKRQFVKKLKCAFCDEDYPEELLWQSGGGIMVCSLCREVEK